MIRTPKPFRAAALVAFAGLALIGARAEAGPLYDPTEVVNGKTFEQWNVLWSQRVIEMGPGGGTSIPGVVDGVALFPAPTSPGAYIFDVTLLPGASFVSSPFFVFGESFDDPAVPDDTPQLIVDLDLFGTAQMTVSLDGSDVLGGTGTELAAYMFGPTYFDDPIQYAQPQYRFDDADGNPVNAVSALFVQGIGTIFRPLSVGNHTVRNVLHSPFFGDFDLTYNIRVVPEPSSVLLMGVGALGLAAVRLRARGR
jgi:hypothetical protein